MSATANTVTALFIMERGKDRLMSDMTDHNKKGTTHENLLEILDNVIYQLDFTKKMIIIMVA